MRLSSSSLAVVAALTILLQCLTPTESFQSFFKNLPTTSSLINPIKPNNANDILIEDQLLSAITNNNNGNNKNRDNSRLITELVNSLEESETSISEPAIAPQVLGRWRLLYTTNENTASPIQRKALDASKYSIYQDIILKNNDDDDNSDDGEKRLVVSQVIQLGQTSKFILDAIAFTSQYPLPSSTTLSQERQNDGTFFGINVLGVSKIGTEAMEDPDRPNARINFLFDEGGFDLNDGAIKIPYPVPFRSVFFRDARKGWLDITYLSERVRISKGNKGTTFILVKENDDE